MLSQVNYFQRDFFLFLHEKKKLNDEQDLYDQNHKIFLEVSIFLS